jgi:predicted nucleic-acid-binding protein
MGLDTNVVLRLLLNDDPAQNSRVDALLDEHGQTAGALLVSDVVLAEVFWTLPSAYAQDQKAVLLALHGLLDEPSIAFESRDAVQSAVEQFTHSKCGFVDFLVTAKNAGLGAEFTATFDRRMAKLPGVRLI